MGIFKRFSTLTATHTKSPRLYATIANRPKKKTAFKAAKFIAKTKTSLQVTKSLKKYFSTNIIFS